MGQVSSSLCAPFVEEKKVPEKKKKVPVPPICKQDSLIPQYLKSATAVRKVIYIDAASVDWNVPANTVRAAVDSGFNVILFAFYLENQPFDFLLLWSQLPTATKQMLVAYAHDRGALLGLSAGGSTVNPYPLDPIAWAQEVSNFAVANLLDVVDYDLENIGVGFVAPGTHDLYAWMNQLNRTTRDIIGPNRYLTHAPQQPYLAVPNTPGSWPGVLGGYSKVLLDSIADGANIDWLSVQGYNQGNNYRTYETVWQNSGLAFPASAYNQLHTGAGIPFEKLVYGSYLLPSDGSGGIYDPQQIHDAFVRAKAELGWQTGSMLWQWNLQGAITPKQWLDIVYAEPLYYVMETTKKKESSKKRRRGRK